MDTAGNTSAGKTKTATPSAAPDTTAPAEVTGLTAAAGNAQVVLTWTDPTDSDFAKAVITFSPTADGVTQPVTVANEIQTATITGLANDTEYTFTVKTVDTADNTSAGTTATATPAIPPANKTALQTALAAANAAKNGTTPGIYWVITADLTTFDAAITEAQTVYDNAAATQAAVDTAKETLEAATTAYTGQKHDAGTNPVTALTAIKTAYNSGSDGSLGTTASPTPVTIIVSGTITYSSGAGSDGWLEISGVNAYPPIILQGAASEGTLNAAGSDKLVLYIADGNKVTLGANLTLTGASHRGVYVFGVGSTFTMNSGTISGNTVDNDGGGGVFVGNSSTFIMTDGTISGNTVDYNGGGVSVYGTFTMNGGTISGNTASRTGGGVYVYNSAAFTKTGGTIYGNSGGATANTANDSGTTGHNGHAVFWDKSGAKKKVDADVTENLSTTDAANGWTAAQ